MSRVAPDVKEFRRRRLLTKMRGATPRRQRSRSTWRLSIPELLFCVLVVGVAGAVLSAPRPLPGETSFTGLSVSERARHLLSRPNCAAARFVGAAPAHIGEVGYWPSHDADGDGISCEPRPW